MAPRQRAALKDSDDGFRGRDGAPTLCATVGIRCVTVESLASCIADADPMSPAFPTLGFERFNGSVRGRPVEPITVRVSHIYRRKDGAWKIAHPHGDNPGPNRRLAEEPDFSP